MHHLQRDHTANRYQSVMTCSWHVTTPLQGNIRGRSSSPPTAPYVWCVHCSLCCQVMQHLFSKQICVLHKCLQTETWNNTTLLMLWHLDKRIFLKTTHCNSFSKQRRHCTIKSSLFMEHILKQQMPTNKLLTVAEWNKGIPNRN